MSGFAEKFRRLSDEFEKKALPKIEKGLDRLGQAVEDCAQKAGAAIQGLLDESGAASAGSGGAFSAPPPAAAFDAAAAAQDVLQKFRDGRWGEARKAAQDMLHMLDIRPDLAAAVDMAPIAGCVTRLYGNGAAAAALEIETWARALIVRGADMGRVDVGNLRPLVQEQLDRGEFALASLTLQWTRFVEKAVSGEISAPAAAAREARPRPFTLPSFLKKPGA